MGADMRGGEAGADNLAAAVTMFGVGTSRQDVGSAGSWVTGEGVEVTFFETMIEAVNSFNGLRSGERERVGTSADNRAIFLV
jgi:hypothetical protein